MSEIHLNSQVFDAFQKASADKTIDAKDAEKLRKAIQADGKIDADEQALLKQLVKPDLTQSKVVISSNNRTMEFSPAGLKFGDSKAEAVLEKTYDKGVQIAEYAAFTKDLDNFLAHNEKLSDPTLLTQNYRGLGETIKQYRDQTGHPGSDPNPAKLARSMERVEKTLRDKGVKLNTSQQIDWAIAKYPFAKAGALAQLERILLTPSSQQPDYRKNALLFLLEHSPQAGDIARKVLEGKGQPSEELRGFAAKHVNASLGQFQKMLKDPNENVRVEALQALANLPSPKTAALLKEFYISQSRGGQEHLSTLRSLKILSESPNADTSKAAKAALKEIDVRTTASYQSPDAASGPARTLDQLQKLLYQSPPPIGRIAETLNEASLRKAAASGLLTLLEQAGAQDQLDGLKTNKPGGRQAVLLEQLAKADAKKLLSEQSPGQKQLKAILADYAEPLTPEKALRRVQGLSDKGLQAQVIELTARKYPKDPALKTWLSQTLMQKGLASGERMALERTRLILDPATATKELAKLLSQPDSGLTVIDKQQLLNSIFSLGKARPELAKILMPLLKQLATSDSVSWKREWAESLQQPQWQNREFYEALLKNPQTLLRQNVIEGFGEMAKKGDVSAV
ncbi:MAG TPA: HEAT repeat domain-containing protein, partial [Candidatus Obscuribacterales bacterium]